MVIGRDVVGPVHHELAAALEQIGAAVGGLHPVAVDVGEGQFADLARRVALLGDPVAEAGSEAMRDGTDTEFPQELGQGAAAEYAAGWGWK